MPVGAWIDHQVCEVWPVLRQTFGYLPSLQSISPLPGWYQIILLDDKGTLLYLLTHEPCSSGRTLRTIGAVCISCDRNNDFWCVSDPSCVASLRDFVMLKRKRRDTERFIDTVYGLGFFSRRYNHLIVLKLYFRNRQSYDRVLCWQSCQ